MTSPDIRPDSALQAQVDAQLLEQGAFSPLQLLFDTGRLDYADYERWRRGEVAGLDEVLMGSVEKITTQLRAAAAYASRIGLVEETQAFSAWSTDRALHISDTVALARLIGCRYAPRQQAPQMDLFFDNPVVALTGGIAAALSRRNLDEAQRQLDRLYAQAPNHANLTAFDRLLEAASHLERPIQDARGELAFLLETAPLAKRLLGSQAGDLLTPLWRQLAQALHGVAFQAQTPTLHRSFASMQAQDWASVADAVRAEADWQGHPPLCLRLAQSGFHRQHRVDSLTGWFQLCWRAPDHAAELLDNGRQPDPAIDRLWRQFTGDDASGALTAQDFPAWMLLLEPGLTQLLPVDLPTGRTGGGSHYRCVHRWIHARRTGQTAEEMAQRKALLASHPLLFEWLKRSI
jgi:hypothetical protein